MRRGTEEMSRRPPALRRCQVRSAYGGGGGGGADGAKGESGVGGIGGGGGSVGFGREGESRRQGTAVI